MSPSRLLESSQCVASKYKIMFGLRCQTTVEQQNNRESWREVKDKEGYTHGLGMLIQLQALWEYFLMQIYP